MAGILASVALAIVAFGGFMYINQPAMIFFPVNTLHESPRSWGMEFENVMIPTDDGLRLHAWYIPQKDATKTLLFFHGNAGNISHRGESLKIFHDLGLNILIFDYRGYGQSEGKPNEAGLYIDAKAAWDHLTRTRGIRDQDIIIFGRSLGGVIAAQLASQTSPSGIILESTFSSAKAMAREMFPILSYIVPVRFDFETEEYIKAVNCPVLVIHSSDDNIIPYTLGRTVYDAANQPKQWLDIKGDHNNGFLQSQPQYQQALENFIGSVK